MTICVISTTIEWEVTIHEANRIGNITRPEINSDRTVAETATSPLIRVIQAIIPRRTETMTATGELTEVWS